MQPDEEGFPASPLGPSFPSLPSRDGESGEILGDKVVALRRAPESPRRLRLRPAVPRDRSQSGHYSLLKQHQQFSGFRIRDALAQQGGLRLRKGSMTYSRGGAPLLQPQYQIRVEMEGGVAVRQTAFPKGPRHWHEEWGQVRFRPPFRVPRKSLSESRPTSPSNTQRVNIWEEFIFGTSALKRKGHYVINEGNSVMNKVRASLEQFLPKQYANIVLCLLYFLFYFLSCCAYNNYLEIALYILFHGHLKLHECAYQNDIDLDFTGSLFEGPAYAWIRGYCQHCIHRDNIKVFDCQMKKMKMDIMATKKI
ncbi:uncharacterized protein LOC134783660 [Penaeus indicus]|uniref:uncharacterized protein LOC134783660 n=1 Tax=Penaeus indicus TaxID=29960 RepID=UPI00300D7848